MTEIFRNFRFYLFKNRTLTHILCRCFMKRDNVQINPYLKNAEDRESRFNEKDVEEKKNGR